MKDRRDGFRVIDGGMARMDAEIDSMPESEPEPCDSTWPPVIVRDRVTERITSAAQQKVTLLCAPGGFGKTIALKEWMRCQTAPIIPIDLAKLEEPSHSGIVAALLPRLMVEQKSETLEFQSFALEILARLRRFEGFIVLDSFERCERGDLAEEEFFLAMIAISGCKWVISTTSVDRLPVGKWLAYGVCDLAIDEYDLSISNDEMAAIREALQLRCSDDELRRIHGARSPQDVMAAALAFAPSVD